MRASPRAEVIILADVLAQEIRGDDFPELGYFDRRNLLQRRLKQAFHETPFAGACGRRDNQILVAGLHASPALAFWLKQLAVLPNPHGVVALFAGRRRGPFSSFIAGFDWRLGYAFVLAAHRRMATNRHL